MDDIVSIDPNKVILRYENEEFFQEELALAWLLAKGLLFVHGSEPFLEDKEDKSLINVSVNCNDTFLWACADAQDIPNSELRNLFEMTRKDKNGWGATKWCCLQRGMRPQKPVEEAMRTAGSWDAELEALPVRES